MMFNRIKLSLLSISSAIIFSPTVYSHDYITSQSISDAPVITLSSYNIMASELSSLESLKSALPDLKSDIIALQEVDYNTQRSSKSSPGNIPVNQAAILAESISMHFSECHAISFEGGYYGMALLSRYPISKTEKIKLGNLNNREERAACVNYISISGIPSPVAIIITHPDQDRDNTLRIKQIRELMGYVDEISKYAIPIIIGDLNLVPASPEYSELMYQMNDTLPVNEYYTFPSWNPNRRIDYILTSKSQKWKIIEAQVIKENTDSLTKWIQISDHLPIRVKMKLMKQ
ncbi:endonuclease/exonuclease/phosphatase family protein [Morganella morganii]|nr:endonuclease/exonuclease/phosphatase family protein [Morganella morganii]